MISTSIDSKVNVRKNFYHHILAQPLLLSLSLVLSVCVCVQCSSIRLHSCNIKKKPSYFHRRNKKMRKTKFIYLSRQLFGSGSSLYTGILCRAFHSSEMNLLFDLWQDHDKTFVVITAASKCIPCNTSMMCTLFSWVHFISFFFFRLQQKSFDNRKLSN